MNIRELIKRVSSAFRAKTDSDQQNELLQRHQVLVENLAAALVIRNRDGNISYCSPFTEVLIGYPLATIYESDDDFFLSLVHEADKDSYNRALELARIGESFEMRHRFTHHSQFEMWIESRTAPLRDESGQLIASLTIMLDVTRAVRFEEQLQEKTTDLQQITAVAAEEIQNEVFTLKGMVNLLDDGVTLDDLKQAVRLSGEKLDQLAQGLTEFGKASTGKGELQTVSVQKTLQLFAEEQQVRGVPVSLNNIPTDARVIADQEDLLLVLSALSDYSCSLCREEALPRLELSLQSSHNQTTILYKDSCPPIPNQLASTIFTPKAITAPSEFTNTFRGKRTPFSLSLTRKKMKRMGGGLDFRITEEGTNCFILSLKTSSSLTKAA